MKITCQSCQSKYNVADEKVQGKIVKIRCRKCGATIVVNGRAAAATRTGQPAARRDRPAGRGRRGDGAVARQRGRQRPAHDDAERARRRVQRGRRDAGHVHLDRRDGRLAAARRGGAWSSALHASAKPDRARARRASYEPQRPRGVRAQAAAPGYEVTGHARYEPPRSYEAPACAPTPRPRAEPKRAAVAKREARARDLFATNAGRGAADERPRRPAGDGRLGSRRRRAA